MKHQPKRRSRSLMHHINCHMTSHLTDGRPAEGADWHTGCLLHLYLLANNCQPLFLAHSPTFGPSLRRKDEQMFIFDRKVYEVHENSRTQDISLGEKRFTLLRRCCDCCRRSCPGSYRTNSQALSVRTGKSSPRLSRSGIPDSRPHPFRRVNNSGRARVSLST